MTPHQVKEGYLGLPPKAKREFVLWAVQREFSEGQSQELEPNQAESIKAALAHGQNSGGVSTAMSPGISAAVKLVLAVILLLILAAAGTFLFKEAKKSGEFQAETTAVDSGQQEAELAAAQEAAEAAEAARPASPTNLEYLAERIGKEVTLRGVPVKSEVGYLYFHEDPVKGARVKLISGGVVVYQSTDLEQWVQNKQQLEVRGTLVRTEEEGLLEVAIDRQIQIKLVEAE